MFSIFKNLISIPSKIKNLFSYKRTYSDNVVGKKSFSGRDYYENRFEVSTSNVTQEINDGQHIILDIRKIINKIDKLNTNKEREDFLSKIKKSSVLVEGLFNRYWYSNFESDEYNIILRVKEQEILCYFDLTNINIRTFDNWIKLLEKGDEMKIVGKFKHLLKNANHSIFVIENCKLVNLL